MLDGSEIYSIFYISGAQTFQPRAFWKLIMGQSATKEFRYINFLNTKRRLLYLKTQFVPSSKHFSSRL